MSGYSVGFSDGSSLPSGAAPLSASSAIFDFQDTVTAVALSPVVPAGSVPQWFTLYALQTVVGEPDVKGFSVGTDAVPTYFVASPADISTAAGNVQVLSPVSHLFEALAAATTVKVLYAETVGAGSPVSVGSWVIVLYWQPAAS